MNQKELGQVQEWLNGDRRFKLLDCTRTAVLKLKGARLQVWLASYMHESDDQQSWLSVPKLMQLTGLSKHAVIEARRWLIANGWLKETGHTAASMYESPTQGAYSVKTYSVDEPKEGAESAPQAQESPLLSQRGATSASAESAPPSAKIAPKGSVSGSAFGSRSVSQESISGSATASVTKNLITAHAASDEQNEVASLLPPCGRDEKQKQNQKPKHRRLGTRHNYDEPFPADFDTWSVSARAEWVEAHRLRPGPVQRPSAPEMAPTPTARNAAPADYPDKAMTVPPPSNVSNKANQVEYVPMSKEVLNAMHLSLKETASYEPPERQPRPKTPKEIECEEFDRDWSAYWNANKAEYLLTGEGEDVGYNQLMKKRQQAAFRREWDRNRLLAKMERVGTIR